ncbi:MAG TPA: glutamine--fructose-6-phosphate transaminase (isomerizing), partial [Polyangiaceae bacterium]|nr:glutamine--fructose-6-phosphate transaminase (isomerizing) [Polyangiaceae bacterium]
CLKRLEYRGYDSAGLALAIAPGNIEITRAPGKLSSLASKLDSLNGYAAAARMGIGHTRWATHGKPTEQNAHPHRSHDGKIVVVHNGIFENYAELKAEFETLGLKLQSDTDTECFPVMVSHLMDTGLDFTEAFRAAVGRMRGIYAIACMHADDPERVLLARSGPPLVIGAGDGEYLFASDLMPLLSHTRNIIFLDDGDLAEVTRKGVRVFNLLGEPIERPPQHIDWDAVAAELGTFDHYMQKEIFEQPEAVARCLADRVPADGGALSLDLPFTAEDLAGIEKVVILACGTSWHAGLVGKYLIEELARIPVEVDYASEYRYRSPLPAAGTLAIAITQSGETADTLAALKEAKRRGARTLAICNVQGSQATRQAEATLLTQAGPEIGVASTKAFTTQLVVLTLFAIHLADAKKTLDAQAREELVASLRELPARLESLRLIETHMQELARDLHTAGNALYLGRGQLYPIALEGALKLKEISYVHAEGYPAGEMKHGPIALIDESLPVLALMPSDSHRDRTLSNLQEAAARDGKLVAFVTRGDRSLDSIAYRVIEMPEVHACLSPIVYSIPLQLFAYHVARLRGCDVDRPRNLAKSVTVE